MDLTREEYLALEPLEFQARFRERLHHTLEIQTYAAIASGKRLSGSQTNTVKKLMQIWDEKGLPKNAPEFARESYLAQATDHTLFSFPSDPNPERDVRCWRRLPLA